MKRPLLIILMFACALSHAVGAVHYLYLNDGHVDAFPEEFLGAWSHEGGNYLFRDIQGNLYTYPDSIVDYLASDAPASMPELLSFRFSSKQNGMLMTDAEGEFTTTDSIIITVGGIGKRLIANFRTTNSDDEVYVGGVRQISKQTSQRFSSPVIYTVSRPGWRMLQPQGATYEMLPFGHDYVVAAAFLSDHPTTSYGIPEIHIQTEDGLIITSKEVYKRATIRIDGAGYYPNLTDTIVEIRGRGNTSWMGASVDQNGRPTSNPKNPYRLRFASKKKPFGMKAGKNWCLIAQAQYGSMLTNPVGQRIADMVGCAASCHFIPVELYINGDYRGQYCFTEKIGFGNNSIDISNDSTAVLLELDQYYDEPYRFHTQYANLPVNIKEPDLSDSAAILTKSFIQSHFNRFVTEVQNGRDISAYADPYYLAKYLMVTDLIYNIELMHPKSTFCYIADIRSDSSRYVFGPIWDLDWAYGYAERGNYCQSATTYDFWSRCQLESTAWMSKLRYNGEATNREYYRTWIYWRDYQLDDLLEYVDDYYALVAAAIAHDHNKWRSGGEAHYANSVANTKNWLKRRTSYVCNYLSNTLGYADRGYLNDETATYIPTISPEAASPCLPGTYDLLGRRVSDDWSTLPPGVYISNGQKIIVR